MAAGLRMTVIAMAASLELLAGCSAFKPWSFYRPPSSQEVGEAPGDPQAWIGKRLSEVTARLGQPTSVQPLQETTGELIFYANPGEPRYVFETGSDGKIVSASAAH